MLHGRKKLVKSPEVHGQSRSSQYKSAKHEKRNWSCNLLRTGRFEAGQHNNPQQVLQQCSKPGTPGPAKLSKRQQNQIQTHFESSVGNFNTTPHHRLPHIMDFLNPLAAPITQCGLAHGFNIQALSGDNYRSRTILLDDSDGGLVGYSAAVQLRMPGWTKRLPGNWQWASRGWLWVAAGRWAGTACMRPGRLCSYSAVRSSMK